MPPSIRKARVASASAGEGRVKVRWRCVLVLGILTGNGLAAGASPELQWLQPANASQFSNPTHLVLQVRVADGSRIRSVQFSAGTNRLGEVLVQASNRICELSWTGVSPGLHGLTAQGRNGMGTEGSPASVLIAVNAPGPPSANARVAVGQASSYALDARGHLHAWGDNQYGQLGTGRTEPEPRPVEISNPGPVRRWKQIAVGFWHVLGLTDDGQLFAWGQNGVGEMGVGDISSPTTGSVFTLPTPVVRPPGVTNWVRVAAGMQHSLAISDEGQVYAWGANSSGALGAWAPGWIAAREPLLVIWLPSAGRWVRIAGGPGDSFSVGELGQLFAWGGNFPGILGIGRADGVYSPTRVLVPPDSLGWLAVYAGAADHTLGLTREGRLYAWGLDQWGELGWAGQSVNYPVPVDASRVERWQMAAVGGDHSVALSDGSQLYAWGGNGFGQLGTGDFANQPLPAPVVVPPGVTGWADVAANRHHCLAVASDGQVYGWGRNDSRQLGLGDTRPRVVPTLIPIDASFRNLPPASDLSVAQTRHPDGRPARLDLSASVEDLDGTVDRVAFYAGVTRLAELSHPPYGFRWTNAPAGKSQLVAVVVDHQGAIGISPPVDVEVPAPPVLQSVSEGRTQELWNLQTGLFHQILRVLNPNEQALGGIRITVLDLPADVRLFNACGASNGAPYAQHSYPLAGGTAVDIRLEYHVPDRRALPPARFVVEALWESPDLNVDGDLVPLDRQLRLRDGSFLVEFQSLTNRSYFIQYSADLADWRTSWPPIPGTGRRLQWIDAGPPRTETTPQSVTNRFYRVVENVAPAVSSRWP